MKRDITNISNFPVVCDRLPESSLIYLGIVFNSGSFAEDTYNNGVTHFIEHMLFKGTQKYSQKDISYIVEENGGYINAFTTKDYTCFYIKMLKEKFTILSDVLLQVCFNPSFSREELLKEKDVIKSEILSVRDNPWEYMMELSEAELLNDSGYALPIEGTAESIENLNFDKMKDYYYNHFLKSNVVGFISGGFEKEHLDFFINSIPLRSYKPTVGYFSDIRHKNLDFKEDFEQGYISAYFSCGECLFADKYAYFLISYMIAGISSGRLFQKLREELGLCYNVDSEVTLYKNAGYLCVNGEVASSKIAEFEERMLFELSELYKNGFTEREFLIAKNQFLLNLISSFESLNGRFEMNIKQFINYGKLSEKEQIIKKIDEYSPKVVNDIYRKIYEKGVSVCRML